MKSSWFLISVAWRFFGMSSALSQSSRLGFPGYGARNYNSGLSQFSRPDASIIMIQDSAEQDGPFTDLSNGQYYSSYSGNTDPPSSGPFRTPLSDPNPPRYSSQSTARLSNTYAPAPASVNEYRQDPSDYQPLMMDDGFEDRTDNRYNRQQRGGPDQFLTEPRADRFPGTRGREATEDKPGNSKLPRAAKVDALTTLSKILNRLTLLCGKLTSLSSK